jgi:hypothetical protein
MNDLTMKLKTDSCAVAEVRATSNLHVALKIAETDRRNAEALRKLSAMLPGVATVLEANAR